MSVAYRFKSLIPPMFRTESPETPRMTYRPRIAEAPDCGGHATEAPESYHGRVSEAPDAGEGRSFYLEHEFTHGRSQS